MKRADHASQAIVDRYPGHDLTEEQLDSVRQATATLSELVETDGLILFALGEALSSFVTTLLDTIAELAGDEVALEAARRVGLLYGEGNYTKYLRNRGLTSGPEVFAGYQDYMHTLRGPRHTTALWATYDESTVLVERQDCLYFCGQRGVPNKYVAEMEASIIEGYRRVDPHLMVSNPKCLTKGSPDGCVHHFTFATTPAP